MITLLIRLGEGDQRIVGVGDDSGHLPELVWFPKEPELNMVEL